MVKPKDCGINNETESSFSLCLVPELVDKKAFKEGNNNPNYMMAGTLYIPKNLMEVVTSVTPGPASSTTPKAAENVFSYSQEDLDSTDPEVKELMGELCNYSRQDRSVTIVALREALAKIRSTISVDSFEDEKIMGSATRKSSNLAEQKYNIMGKVMKFWGDRKPKETGRRMDKVKTKRYFPKVESDKSVELFNAGTLSEKASGASVPADEILKPAKNQQVKEADPNRDVILNYNFMQRKIYLKYDKKNNENSKNLLKLVTCEEDIYGCRAIENISTRRCVIKGNEKKHRLLNETGNGENCVMPIKDACNPKLDFPDYLLYDENLGKGGKRSWRTLGVSNYSNEYKELTSYLTQWHAEYSINEYIVMSSQENWSNNYRKYEACSALQKQKLNENVLHVKKRNFLDNFLFDHPVQKKENNLPFPTSNFHKKTNKNGKYLFKKSLYLSPSFLQHNWNAFIPQEQTVAYQNDSTREIIVTPPQRSTSVKMIKNLERPKCRIEIKGEGYRGKFNVGLDPDLDEAIYKSIQTIRDKCRNKHYKREVSRKHSSFICDLTDRLKRKLVCKRNRKSYVSKELVEDDDIDDSDIYVCKPYKEQIGSSSKKFLVYKKRKGGRLSKPNESDEDIFIPISSDVLTFDKNRSTRKQSQFKESGKYSGSGPSTRVPVSSPSVIGGRRSTRKESVRSNREFTPDEDEDIYIGHDRPRETVRKDSLRSERGRTTSLRSDNGRRPSGQMKEDSFTPDEEGDTDRLRSERGRTTSLRSDSGRRPSGQMEEDSFTLDEEGDTDRLRSGRGRTTSLRSDSGRRPSGQMKEDSFTPDEEGDTDWLRSGRGRTTSLRSGSGRRPSGQVDEDSFSLDEEGDTDRLRSGRGRTTSLRSGSSRRPSGQVDGDSFSPDEEGEIVSGYDRPSARGTWSGRERGRTTSLKSERDRRSSGVRPVGQVEETPRRYIQKESVRITGKPKAEDSMGEEISEEVISEEEIISEEGFGKRTRRESKRISFQKADVATSISGFPEETGDKRSTLCPSETRRPSDEKKIRRVIEEKSIIEEELPGGERRTTEKIIIREETSSEEVSSSDEQKKKYEGPRSTIDQNRRTSLREVIDTDQSGRLSEGRKTDGSHIQRRSIQFRKSRSLESDSTRRSKEEKTLRESSEREERKTIQEDRKSRKEEERRSSTIQKDKSKQYEKPLSIRQVRDSEASTSKSGMALRTFRSKGQPRRSKLSSEYKSIEPEEVSDDEETSTEEKSTSYRRSVYPSDRKLSESKLTEEKSTSYRPSVDPSYRNLSESTQTEEKCISYRRSVDSSYRKLSASTETEDKLTSYRRSIDPSYRKLSEGTETEDKWTSYRRSIDPSYRRLSGSTETEDKSTSYRRSIDPSYRRLSESTETDDKWTSYRRSIDPSYRKLSESTETDDKSTSYRRSIDPSYRKLSASTETEDKSTSYRRSVDPSYRELSERKPTEEKWTSYRRSTEPSDRILSESDLKERSTSYERPIELIPTKEKSTSYRWPIDRSDMKLSDRGESDEMPSLYERLVEESTQEKVKTKDDSTEYERSIQSTVGERRKSTIKSLGTKSIESVLERSRDSSRPLEERSSESIVDEYGKSSMKQWDTDEERRKSKISLSDVGRSIDSIIEERKTFARRPSSKEFVQEGSRISTPSYADRSLESISEESRTMTPSDVDLSVESRESKEECSNPVVHIKYYQPPSDSQPGELVTGDVTLKPISKVSLENKIEESQRLSGIIHVSRPEERSEEDKRISGTINITRSPTKPDEDEKVSADIRIKSLGKFEETERGISPKRKSCYGKQKKDERSVDSSISEICSLGRKCRDMSVRFDTDKEDRLRGSHTSAIDDECTCITPRRGMSGDTGYIPGTGEPSLGSERRMQRRHSRIDPGASYSGSGFGYIPCPYRSRRGDYEQSFNERSGGSNHSSRRYRGNSGRGVSFYNSPNQGTSSSSSYSRSNSRGRSERSNNGSRQFDVHGYSPSHYCHRVAVNSDDELTDDLSNTTIAMPLLYYPFFNSNITSSKQICKKRPMSVENICEKSSDFNLFSSKSFTAFYKVQKSMNCYYMQLDTNGELKKKSCLKVKRSFCNICKKPIKKRPSSPCKPKNGRSLCQKSDFLEKSGGKNCCYSKENNKKSNTCSNNSCHSSRDKSDNRDSCSKNKNDASDTKVSDLEGATWDFFGLINNECSSTGSKNPYQHQSHQISCKAKPKCCCKKEPKRCNCIKQRTCSCKKKKPKASKRCNCKKPEPCQCWNKKKKCCSRETCPKRSRKVCRGHIHGNVESSRGGSSSCGGSMSYGGGSMNSEDPCGGSAFDEGICSKYGLTTYDKSQGVAFRPGGSDYQQQFDSNGHFLGSGKRQEHPKRLSRCPELLPRPQSSNLFKNVRSRPRSESPLQKQHSLLSLKTFRSPSKPSGHRARSASPRPPCPRFLRKPLSLLSLKSFRPTPSASTSKISNKTYAGSLLGTQSDYSSNSQQKICQKKGLSQHSLVGFSSTGQTRSRNENQSGGYHENFLETYITSPSPSMCPSPSQTSPRQGSKPSLEADSNTDATVPTYIMQSNCMSPFNCQNTCDPCSSVYSRRPPDSHPFFCEQEPYRRRSPARTELCPKFKKSSSCKPDTCKPDPCAPCSRRSPCFSNDPCPSCPPRSSCFSDPCPPCPQRSSSLADPCLPRSSCFQSPCSPRASCMIDPCPSCSRSCCMTDPCLPCLPRSPCLPDSCSPCSPRSSCCSDPCSPRSSCSPCPPRPSCLPCPPRPSCLPDPCPPCLPRSSCLPDPCSSCSPRSSCLPDPCPSRTSCVIDPCPPCLPRSLCKPDPCSPCPPRSCKPDPCCSSLSLCKTESCSTPRSSCKPDPCSPYSLSSCRPDPCCSGSGRSILKKANKYYSCMNNLNCSNNSSKECFSRQCDDCGSSSTNCCRSNYQSALRRMSSNCCYGPPKCCLKPCGPEFCRDSSSDNCCSPPPCRPNPSPCCSFPRSQRSKAFQESADNCNEKCPPNFRCFDVSCNSNNDLCQPCEISDYTPKKDWSRAKKYLSNECLQDDVGQNTSNPSPSVKTKKTTVFDQKKTRFGIDNWTSKYPDKIHKKGFSMFKKGKSKYDPNKGQAKKMSLLGDESGNSIPIKAYCSPGDCSTTCNSCIIPDFNCCENLSNRRKQYESCGADNAVSRHMASSWKKWSGFNTNPCTVAENVSIMDKYIDTDAKKRRNPDVKYGVSFSPSTLESDYDSDLKGKFKTNIKRKKCPSSSRKSTMAVNYYCGSDSCEDSPPPSWSRKSHYDSVADYQSLRSPTCNEEVTIYPSWTTESTKRSTIAVSSNPYRIDKRRIDDDTCISAWRKVSKTDVHNNEEHKKKKKSAPPNKWSLKSFRRIPEDVTCAMYPWNDSCCLKSRPTRNASSTWARKAPSEVYDFDNSFPGAVGSSSTSKSCWANSISPSSFFQSPGEGTTYPQKKNIWVNDAQTVMFSSTVDNVGSQHLWKPNCKRDSCEVKNESCKPGLMAFLNAEVNSTSSTSDQSIKSKLIIASSSDLTTTSAESVYSKRPSAISINSSPLSSDISGPKCLKKRSHSKNASKVICPVIKTDTCGCEPNGTMASASFSKRERKCIFDKSKRKPQIFNDEDNHSSCESSRNSTEESICHDPSCSVGYETNENICNNPKNTLFRIGSSCNENRASEFYGSKRKKSLCRWSGSLSD